MLPIFMNLKLNMESEGRQAINRKNGRRFPDNPN
jgi:hypothetical protein